MGMTQEDKDLLLKDLCARLPYGVICNDNRHGSGRVTYIDITPDDSKQKNGKVVVYYFDFDECGELENCKPYLRPMSSMTEEEKKEFDEITLIHTPWGIQMDRIPKLTDWLNAHHFDFRNLIKRGLAIEVTEKNKIMKDYIFKFRKAVKKADIIYDNSDFVNDFMFHNNLYGENIYNELIKELEE